LLKLSPLLLLGGFAFPHFENGCSMPASGGVTPHRPRCFAAVIGRPSLRTMTSCRSNAFRITGTTCCSIDRFRSLGARVGGAVSRAGRYSLDQIRALPKIAQNTRHICVEGWDAIGRFGGSRLADFLDLVGADPRARFSPSPARTIITSPWTWRRRASRSRCSVTRCTTGRSTAVTAPPSPAAPTKLGYKQAKYVMTITVTDVLPAKRSYWGDQGYSWYGGL